MTDAQSPLSDTVRQVIKELDVEHAPMWVNPDGRGYTSKAVPGKDPVGCWMCYPNDGGWPCTTRMIADDLRSALEAK